MNKTQAGFRLISYWKQTALQTHFILDKAPSGVERPAEIHWYEATGIGRKEFKIKRFLEN